MSRRRHSLGITLKLCNFEETGAIVRCIDHIDPGTPSSQGIGLPLLLAARMPICDPRSIASA